MSLMFCLAALLGVRLPAQSTFGTILGTVHDASGALIAGAQLTLVNTGTGATRTAGTDSDGNYAFRNIDVGTYKLTITAQGFQTQTLPAITLTAREARRVDTSLKLTGETQTVVVIDDSALPVITTEVSNLAETKVGEELIQLPIAIYSRSTGSTRNAVAWKGRLYFHAHYRGRSSNRRYRQSRRSRHNCGPAQRHPRRHLQRGH